MKNLILSLALGLSIFGSMAASAKICSLKYAVHIDSVAFFSHGYGSAVAWCNDDKGEITSQRNYSVNIDGLGVGLGVFDLQGRADGLPIATARGAQGSYIVAEDRVGTVGTWNTPLIFNGAQGQFVGFVQSGTGLGVMLNNTRWTFTLAN